MKRKPHATLRATVEVPFSLSAAQRLRTARRQHGRWNAREEEQVATLLGAVEQALRKSANRTLAPITLYLDTEFNGHGGDLISIALVGSSGPSFYEALPVRNATPWVRKHVLPVLGRAPLHENRERALEMLSHKLAAFLNQFPSVRIVADWPADIHHLMSLLMPMPGTQIVVPPMSMELISQPITYRPEVRHNALSDAQALLRCVEAKPSRESAPAAAPKARTTASKLRPVREALFERNAAMLRLYLASKPEMTLVDIGRKFGVGGRQVEGVIGRWLKRMQRDGLIPAAFPATQKERRAHAAGVLAGLQRYEEERYNGITPSPP